MAFYRSGGGGTLTETVLWTNPSPTSNFTAGVNIALSQSMANFQYLRVYSRVSTSNATEGYITIPTDNFIPEQNSMYGYTTMIKDNGTWYERLINKIDDTTVKFADATKRRATNTSSSEAVPTKITGLK